MLKRVLSAKKRRTKSSSSSASAPPAAIPIKEATPPPKSKPDEENSNETENNSPSTSASTTSMKKVELMRTPNGKVIARKLKVIISPVNLSEAKKRLKRAESELEEVQAQYSRIDIGALEALENLIVELKRELGNKENEVDALNEQLLTLQAFEARVQEQAEEKKKLEEKHSVVMRTADEKIAQLESKCSEHSTTIKMEAMIKKQEQEIFHRKIAAAEEAKRTSVTEYASFKTAMDARIVEMEAKIETLKTQQAEKENALQTVVHNKEAGLAEMNARLLAEKKIAEQLERKVSEHLASKRQAEEERSKLEKQMEDQLASMKESLETSKAHQGQQETKWSKEMQETKEELKATLALLESERSNARAAMKSVDEHNRSMEAAAAKHATFKETMDQKLVAMEKDVKASQNEHAKIEEELRALILTKDEELAKKEKALQAEKEATEQILSDFTKFQRSAEKNEAKLAEKVKALEALQDLSAANMQRETAAKRSQVEKHARLLKEKEAESEKLSGEFEAFKASMQIKIAAMEKETKKSGMDTKKLEAALRDEIEAKQKEASILESEKQRVQRLKAKIAEKDSELQSLRDMLSGKVDADIFDKERKELQLAIQRVEKLLHSKAAEARSLRKQLIDMRGQIRTLVRIRPKLETEVEENVALEIVADGSVVLEQNKKDNPEESVKQYNFDAVFGGNASQEEVYQEIRPLIESVVDGYNACIFAYGQTGSGKTYTMDGAKDGSDPGMYHLSLDSLFKLTRRRSADDQHATIKVSLLEIYNEKLSDLLADDKNSKDEPKELAIRKHPKTGAVMIDGLTEIVVKTTEEVHSTIARGKLQRTVRATDYNLHSSRSHLVLLVKVTMRGGSRSTTTAKLTLIDLAGSESLSTSVVTKQMKRETCSINKSLSALGDVMHALQKNSSFVPFRNSKLTELLRDSLGGRAKTLMVVQTSPLEKYVKETRSTLDFASRVSKICLGSAKRSFEAESLVRAKKEKKEAEKKAENLSEKLVVTNVALSAERKKRVDLESRLKALQEQENDELSVFRASKGELEAERAKLLLERSTFAEEKKTLAAELNRTKSTLQSQLRAQTKNAEGSQSTLMKRNAELSRQVSSLKDRVAQLERANQKHAILAKEYGAYQKEVRELRCQNSAFKARLGKETPSVSSPVPFSAKKLRRMTTAGNVSSPLAKSSKKKLSEAVPKTKSNKENSGISTIAVSVCATPPPAQKQN